MKNCKLTVAIVNWNTQELLARCLESFYADMGKEIDYEVIVIDNGSVDDSVKLVKDRYSNIKLILNEDNIGFAEANNKAIAAANGEYILFLNTDVIITPNVVTKLIEFMDKNSKAGLCTPSLTGKSGKSQETSITFPGLFTELFGRLNPKQPDNPFKAQAVRGACMLVRTNVIRELGGFSERYFLFLEETDLCLRLHKKGYEVWHVPYVKAIHTGGGSAEEEKTGARIEYWKSRYIFFRNNYFFLCYCALSSGLWLKLALDWGFNLLGAVCTLSLNKRFKNKLKDYSVIILWHVLGRPCDWGIGSSNIIETNGYCVRSEFQLWWEKNKDFIFEDKERAKLIKENSSRKLFIYNDEVYVKLYKKKSLFNKSWEREWRITNRIRQFDIPTVLPIAMGDGFLITKRIDNIKPLHKYILEDFKGLNFNERLNSINSFAEFMRKLHTKGVCHGDLHAGNIFVEKKEGSFKFYIADLHRAGIGLFISRRKIINNLVQLNKFISMQLSITMQMRFLKKYASGTRFEKDYKLFAGIIDRDTKIACSRLWRKRDGLYLKKKKYGIIGNCGGVKYILNPQYEKLDVREIVNKMKSCSGNVIKDSKSSFVSSCEIDDAGNVILKIYRQKKIINYVKDIFRKSRGFKAWRGSWALINRCIDTPLPVIAGEERVWGIVKRSFIITKYIDHGENLTLFTRDISDGLKQLIKAEISSYIKKIHDRGIYPLDMKGSNIVVSKNERGTNVFLIDLDHIKIKREVSVKEKLRNIMQIKMSTGLLCTEAISIKRILIVKPSSLGDIAQSFPVANMLKANFKSSAVWWLANKNYIDLLKLVPSINGTIAFDRAEWGKLKNILKTPWQIIAFLMYTRSKHFDIVLDMQGLFRSGFITWASGAPVRIGFSNAREFAYMFYNVRVDPSKDIKHAQERYFKLAEYICDKRQEDSSMRIPYTIKQWAENMWADEGHKKTRVVINPGGRWESKKWLADRYTQLINKLGQKYNAAIILTGDNKDKSTVADILKDVTMQVIDLSGCSTLVELTAVLASSDILITNDSGPMHLAHYLGIPLVAIFGPTDPERTGTKGKNSAVLRAEISCSPCFKRKCGMHTCMELIKVEDVLTAVEDDTAVEDVLKKKKTMV